MEKENMLGVALAEIAGPIKDFSDKLGGPDGARWWGEFKHYLRKEPTWVHRLLELVTTVKVEGCKRFVAADHFVVGKDGIFYLGADFQRVFLGKVETDVQPATLKIHRLTESSLDAPIRAELGSDREEIALAHFWTVFKKRSSVEANWFFAYIRGTDGVVWAVYADRYSGGWRVVAYSVSYPYRWPAGYQVFSH